MKIPKILLSFLLVIMMVIPAFAASVEVKPGEVVYASITFTSEGAYSYQVSYEVPAGLELVGEPTKSDENDFVTGSVWAHIGSVPVKSSSLTFGFKVPDTAKVGDTYQIKATLQFCTDNTGDNDVPGSVTGDTIVIVGEGEHEHSWDEGKVTKDPTCEDEGEKTYTCTICGDTKTDKIPAAGHKWGDGAVTVEPSCKPGEKTYTCTVCGKTKTEEISANGKHSWDEGKVTKDPTCEDDGEKTYTCKICGETKSEKIPAAGHKWVDEVTDATCGKAGEKKTVCSVCGKVSNTTLIPATEAHTWDEGKITTPATCTDTGIKTFTCTICGNTKAEIVKAIGHKWDAGKITVEATNNKPGKKVYTCSVCGATKEEEIAPSGHIWLPGVVTKEATCEEDGILTITCKECGVSYTERIPATGHDPILVNKATATPFSNGYTGDWVCSKCGKVLQYGEKITPLPIPKTPTEPKKDDTKKEETVINNFPFTDVKENDPFYKFVKYVYDNGIMNGVSATEFAPYNTLTRGMIVTILYRLEGEPNVDFNGTFTDVEANTWYSEAVEWAAITGIVKGYGNGKFGPTDPITRQQLAAIFFRYANYKNFKIVSDDFDADDKDLIAAYAIEALNWGVENDVIWVTNDLVRPTENALRWEVAAAIYAFCEYVAK